MNPEQRDKLYNAWLAADNTWMNELTRIYGRSASDKRYDSRYNAKTPELERLRQVFIDAGDAYRRYIRNVS